MYTSNKDNNNNSKKETMYWSKKLNKQSTILWRRDSDCCNFGKGDTNKKLLWIFWEMGQSFDPFPSRKGFNEKGLCFPSYYDGQEEKVCGKEWWHLWGTTGCLRNLSLNRYRSCYFFFHQEKRNNIPTIIWLNCWNMGRQ